MPSHLTSSEFSKLALIAFLTFKVAFSGKPELEGHNDTTLNPGALVQAPNAHLPSLDVLPAEIVKTILKKLKMSDLKNIRFVQKKAQ
ncbi:MAG: hypothetical protein ACRC4G_05315 [Alphaproteobacteria bacterium]